MTRSSLTLSIAAGTCLGTAFLHPVFSPLSVIGLILFIRAVLLSGDLKTVAQIGLIVGALKYAGALMWFWHTYPLTWLGIAPIWTQLSLIGGVWVFSVFFLSLGLTMTAVLFFWLYRRQESYLYLFPFILIGGEVLGSFVFSIYSLGPGSVLNIDFSFGYAGYSLAYLPGLLSLGIIGGVYSLSMFGGALALLVYLIWFQDRRLKSTTTRILILTLAIWLLTSNAYLHLRSPASFDRDVIAISTRFDHELLGKSGGYEIKEIEVKKAVVAALKLNPDIILLPEDSRLVSSFTSKEEIFSFLNQAYPDSNALLVDSSRATLNPEEVTLRAYSFDLKDDGLYVIDKQRFAPQGEYLPHFFTFWMKLLGQKKFIDKVIADRSYRPGPANSYTDIPNSIPSVLFCSESISPMSVNRVWREDGPSVILHPVSQAWFSDSKILRYQLDRMLRLQAISNNTNIVQAGNMAPSLVYKSDGQVDYGLALDQSEYFTLYRFGGY